jgi:transposase InsO family protein
MSWSVSDQKLEKLKAETQLDVQLKTVLEYVRLGWPEYKEDCKLAAREYYGIKEELSEFEGLVTRGGRIVIPWSQREDILQRIHDGHQGIQKCRERANQCVWWPGMSQAIKDLVGRCRHCQEHRPTQAAEPLTTSTLPEYPFQKVGTDLFEYKGKHYLVLIDYYSRYIEVAKLGKTTAEGVIGELKAIFGRWGIPEIVVSDNGPQFSSETFASFASQWNFTHVTSSPKFPQSNGEAEKAVDISKRLLAQEDFQLALLTYRGTPIPSLGFSPAQMMMNRQVRTTLPCVPGNLIPKTPEAEALKDNDRQAKAMQKHFYDRSVKPLSELQPGQKVLMKDDDEKIWQREGQVVSQCAPRSYMVQTSGGATLRRNRRHLQPFSGAKAAASQNAQQQSQPLQGQATTQQAVQQTMQSPQPVLSQPVEQQQQPEPVQPPGSTGATADARVVTRSGRVVNKPERFKD